MGGKKDRSRDGKEERNKLMFIVKQFHFYWRIHFFRSLFAIFSPHPFSAVVRSFGLPTIHYCFVIWFSLGYEIIIIFHKITFTDFDCAVLEMEVGSLSFAVFNSISYGLLCVCVLLLHSFYGHIQSENTFAYVSKWHWCRESEWLCSER